MKVGWKITTNKPGAPGEEDSQITVTVKGLSKREAEAKVKKLLPLFRELEGQEVLDK